MEKHYFLFGEAICRELEDGGIKKALKLAKRYGYALYKWDETTCSPVALLVEYDGWAAFAEITEEQYNQFAKL